MAVCYRRARPSPWCQWLMFWVRLTHTEGSAGSPHTLTTQVQKKQMQVRNNTSLSVCLCVCVCVCTLSKSNLFSLYLLMLTAAEKSNPSETPSSKYKKSRSFSTPVAVTGTYTLSLFYINVSNRPTFRKTSHNSVLYILEILFSIKRALPHHIKTHSEPQPYTC